MILLQILKHEADVNAPNNPWLTISIKWPKIQTMNANFRLTDDVETQCQRGMLNLNREFILRNTMMSTQRVSNLQ